jgi:hypothetical protein
MEEVEAALAAAEAMEDLEGASAVSPAEAAMVDSEAALAASPAVAAWSSPADVLTAAWDGKATRARFPRIAVLKVPKDFAKGGHRSGLPSTGPSVRRVITERR